MASDSVEYLTPSLDNAEEADVLYSKLIGTLKASSQKKATPDQWTKNIQSFSTKGVKRAEIENSGVLEWLAVQPAEVNVLRDDLLTSIERQTPRIKCVTLGKPKYPSFTNIEGGNYGERLYILSSQGMAADDKMEDLMYRIEDLGFNPAPLLENPGLIDQLENEYKLLKVSRPTLFDFKFHHFASEIGNHGKNLMAHARYTITDDVFFTEEVQSDWAQKGRAQNWPAAFPQAPFVTSTEQWAGVVLRDLMHQAAATPAIKSFAWINSKMRNGWNRAENESDGLAYFYDTIVRKLVEKAISEAGGRVALAPVTTKNGIKELLSFEMTPAVRALLLRPQPMYSREALLSRDTTLEDPSRTEEVSRVLRDCKPMLGSVHTIRFVAKLYDLSQGTEVAGQLVQRGITLSLRAKDLDRVSRHEAWHFADENFLLAHEKREMRLAFSVGTDLNKRTHDALIALGDPGAAAQCVNEKECAAHAFALWCEGKLAVTDPKPHSIFKAVISAINKTADWLEQRVFGVEVKTPEQLFEAMRSGALAARQELAEAREGEAAPRPG